MSRSHRGFHRLLPRELKLVRAAPFQDAGHGVCSHGVENLPAQGAAILEGTRAREALGYAGTAHAALSTSCVRWGFRCKRMSARVHAKASRPVR